MNDREFITAIRDQCNAQLGAAPGPTPTPAPTPTPTPAPTPAPVPGNAVEFQFKDQNGQVWIDNMQPGVPYYAKLPASNNGTVQVGQGRTGTPSNVQIGIGRQPGAGIGSPLPNGAQGDANAGFSLAWSDNPTPNRGGGYNQAKVVPGETNYVTIVAHDPGGIVCYWY